MNEEKYLIERVGKENPFRVPEGYFDTLKAEVMARVDVSPLPVIPAEKKKAKVVRLRPIYYAVAASVCALFISVAAYVSFDRSSVDPTVQQAVAQQDSYDSFDAAADYIMVDNEAIYACLSSDY
jgi:hypothetical protein